MEEAPLRWPHFFWIAASLDAGSTAASGRQMQETRASCSDDRLGGNRQSLTSDRIINYTDYPLLRPLRRWYSISSSATSTAFLCRSFLRLSTSRKPIAQQLKRVPPATSKKTALRISEALKSLCYREMASARSGKSYRSPESRLSDRAYI